MKGTHVSVLSFNGIKTDKDFEKILSRHQLHILSKKPRYLILDAASLELNLTPETHRLLKHFITHYLAHAHYMAILTPVEQNKKVIFQSILTQHFDDDFSKENNFNGEAFILRDSVCICNSYKVAHQFIEQKLYPPQRPQTITITLPKQKGPAI